MGEWLRSLWSVLLLGGLWATAAVIIGCIGALYNLFAGIVVVRAVFFLWHRLPLWEAENYRQRMLEQDAWKDDEQGMRLVHYAARQRRKWNYVLVNLLAEAAVIVISTGLIVAGQPAGWFLAGIGTLIVGMLMVAAWAS